MKKNRRKALTIDYATDYLEYDHLTGEKIYHGKLREALKIRTPYFKCINLLTLQDKKSKLERVIQCTYHTVDDQSLSETIIDLDMIASVNIEPEDNIISFKSKFHPLPDKYFDQLVKLGKIVLEKANIEFETLA